jgi:hypothetical protein
LNKTFSPWASASVIQALVCACARSTDWCTSNGW